MSKIKQIRKLETIVWLWLQKWSWSSSSNFFNICGEIWSGLSAKEATSCGIEARGRHWRKFYWLWKFINWRRFRSRRSMRHWQCSFSRARRTRRHWCWNKKCWWKISEKLLEKVPRKRCRNFWRVKEIRTSWKVYLSNKCWVQMRKNWSLRKICQSGWFSKTKILTN